MWTVSSENNTSRRRSAGGAVVLVALLLGALLATGLLLREYAPGNMGNGFLQGAAVALVAAGVRWWRVSRRPARASTFERAWTQTGDERDDLVLTRALAVLGLLAFPLTAVAAIVIAFGATVAATMAVLLVAQPVVLGVSFATINRRS
jgi:hypothetical protein